MSGNAALLPFVDEHAIVVAAPPSRVWEQLLGSHRFSRYALTSRIDDLGGGRLHVLVTRRVLSGAGRRAER